MILLTLSLFQTSFCQVFPSENKSERLNACYSLVKQKLSSEKNRIEDFSKSFENPEKVINFIGTELLMTCYTSISVQTSEKVLKETDNTLLAEYCKENVDLDFNKYHKASFELGNKHFDFFQEIKNVKQMTESTGIFGDTMHWPISGTWYFILIFIIFGGILFWASSLVLKKPENKSKTGKKIKKKN